MFLLNVSPIFSFLCFMPLQMVLFCSLKIIVLSVTCLLDGAMVSVFFL